MDRQTFNKQLHRLKTQWPHSYGEERAARVWASFQKIHDSLFIEIVDMALDTMRSAPLVEEMCTLEQQVKKRASYSKSQAQFSIQEKFERMAEKNTGSASKEFVDKCLELLRSRLDGKITMEQFLQGCDWLDASAR